MSITNKDRINDNNDRINRLIELVKQKALTSNPKYATTEAEMDAMLTDRNVGKIVKYIGAPVGTPFVVGDTVDKLYFNTDVRPDFDAIKASSTVIKGADIHGDWANAYFTLYVTGEVPAGTAENYFGFFDMSEVQEGLFVIADDEMRNMVYISQDISADVTGSEAIEGGWQMDSIEASALWPRNDSTPTWVVQQLGGQDLWGSYISKEPFTSGKYEKNALYIIAEGEREVIENPTAVGDEVTQVYFDTTKSIEEIYTDLQKLNWIYDEENELYYVMAFMEAFETGKYVMIGKIEWQPDKFIYLIGNGGFEPDIFAYSPDMTPTEADLGVVTEWGWQATSPVASLETYTITQVNDKDIWGGWLSTSDQFTTIGEPTAPRARRLNITEGTLTITKNGTFNVANMETVIVNVAGSGSGGSLVATTEEELNALDTPENVGKTVSYNDGLYIITED